jgi:hypothetical protein
LLAVTRADFDDFDFIGQGHDVPFT